MLDYLVTSRARRELLRSLWLDGDRGSVSALARACGVSFTVAHRELDAMKAAGLALAEREGAALEYSANRRHPQAHVLISLLKPPAGGARFAAPATGDGRPSAEDALVDSLTLSHGSEAVALAIPFALWRQRDQLDHRRLAQAATRRNERPTLGFYLQLAGQLGGDARLARRARSLRDRRRTVPRPFFARTVGAPGGKSLPLGRRWGYLIGLELDRFVEAFTRERRRARG